MKRNPPIVIAHASHKGLALPLVLATGNPDKATEITEIFIEELRVPLALSGVAVGNDTVAFLIDDPERVVSSARTLPLLGRAPDVAETGTTLEDNARIKAMALVSALGVASLADDTGLEVDALGGAPGVRAGRYAGEQATYEENRAKLLAELDGVAADDRTARFATVALLAFPDGREVIARGEVEGVIAQSPRGAGGFGYDPVFVPREGDGRSFAEMTPAEKHGLSHRGRAFRALATALERDA